MVAGLNRSCAHADQQRQIAWKLNILHRYRSAVFFNMTHSVGHGDICHPCLLLDLVPDGRRVPQRTIDVPWGIIDLLPRVEPCVRCYLMVAFSIFECSHIDPSNSYSIVCHLIHLDAFSLFINMWMKLSSLPQSFKYMTLGDTPPTPPSSERTTPWECFQSSTPVQCPFRTASSPSITTNMPEATSSTPALAPSASYTNILPEQLADLLSKVCQNNGPAPRKLVKPRIGGLGFGAWCKGIDPMSATCMHHFDTAVVKIFTAKAPIVKS